MSKRKISLDDILSEVKEINKWRKSNSNGDVLNKDMLLWLLSKTIKQDGKIGKLEVTTKVLLMLFCGLAVKIIIF